MCVVRFEDFAPAVRLSAVDVVEPLELAHETLQLPTGPGLGVQVNADKLAHYAALNDREGDLTH